MNPSPAPPGSLPYSLWKKLTVEFNESQLRAIKSVCNRNVDTESSDETNLPLILLQGPPGTGKVQKFDSSYLFFTFILKYFDLIL